MNLPDSGIHVTSLNQGLFSTTIEAEKRDPGTRLDKCMNTETDKVIRNIKKLKTA